MAEIIAAIALALGAAGIYIFGKKRNATTPVASTPAGTTLTLEARIRNEMKALSLRRGIPLELIVAQVKKESGGGGSGSKPFSNARIDNVNALGSAGEIGLMQIKPAVLVDYNRANKTAWNSDKLWDWQFNLEVGTWYLKELKDRDQTWRDALMEYNLGERGYRENPYDPSARQYASTILSWAGMA